jgi:hypothetical protein
MMMCIFLIFTSCGISILIVRHTAANSFATGCDKKTGLVWELDQIYKSGNEILCTASCPCDTDKGIYKTDVANKLVIDKMGQTKLEECPISQGQISTNQKLKYFPMLEVLEKTMSCAGFCSDSPLYLFSDVRKGIPANGDCRNEIVDRLHTYSAVYAGAMLVIGILGLTGWGMSFAICFISTRKFKGRSNYDYAKYGISKEN